ncbi:glycoside hydrolase family 97 catalytic domain-containing protein [Pelomonas sp. V22]|uniref:glycoside hydrolase family 97 protein n=1 Tax=Pelomonas sp. V22 TaxID=2822139 RepID=UPI0024A8FD49|nr:glycoside hydrolase family 97 protein [Pelomonas sp. V22]MDI4635642.1 glycoside hydrolase family 97 catalytic domain-containing protein [Pelomonas sp. V22]
MRRLLMLLPLLAASAFAAPLTSPDQQLAVELRVNEQQQLVYTVQRAGQPVLLASRLGLMLEGADLGSQLALVSSSPVLPHSERYEMAVGKRSQIHYQANEQTFTVKNPAGQQMQLIFRASNDGVAFRYVVAEPSLARKSFREELSSFRFAPTARAWLQPMSVAQTGWSRVNPAYEEHYVMDMPAGTASPSPAGWVFPALFKTGDTWVALTEANMDGSFHASRLRAESSGGEYQLGTPMPAEVFTGGGLLANVEGTLTSPWRVLAIGSLKTVMESTLGTDLAAPAVAFDKAKLQPGHASWSWALLKDDATVFEVQKRFVDYAADMHWNYTLVDADWDLKIGDAKMKELVDYAAAKGVAILVWYNSSGPWNDTKMTPKSALLSKEQRAREFARVKALGIQGLKIDFFNGDGQSMIAYYVDLLKETAAAGLLVNFHGATLPRGWTRTYPNLMTAEGVKGFEFATFEQQDQDKVGPHLAMLTFARNLFDPMDFTPLVFGDIPKIKRSTRNGFELAQAVLLLSGIQHFAEVPEGMATVPPQVKALLQALPRRWDEVRFLAGEPGKHLVLARRAGQQWFVAGFNAETSDKTVTLDLSFLKGREAELIGDGDGPRDFKIQGLKAAARTALTMKPNGGFVARFK